jgi:hypothetical protein
LHVLTINDVDFKLISGVKIIFPISIFFSHHFSQKIKILAIVPVRFVWNPPLKWKKKIIWFDRGERIVEFQWKK